MRVIECAAIAAALVLSGAAHAQAGGGSAPPPPPAASAPSPTFELFRGPDERLANLNRLRDEVEAGPVKSSRPVPVVPEDVAAGSEVRDSKGLVLGAIERVGMDYAVIASPGGKIEVEFSSLAKNNKGLLINMRKAKFDALVAGSARPAK